MARKELNNVRKDNLDKHEINGDEFIYLEGSPSIIHPRTGVVLRPTWIHETEREGRASKRAMPSIRLPIG